MSGAGLLQIGQRLPSRLAPGAPWWSWCGGALGSFYICTCVIFSQPLGAGTLTAVSVTAQLITAIVLDACGLVGFQKRRVHWARLVGAVLLVAGMVLITRFRGEAVHGSSHLHVVAAGEGAAPASKQQQLQGGANESLAANMTLELRTSPSGH